MSEEVSSFPEAMTCLVLSDNQPEPTKICLLKITKRSKPSPETGVLPVLVFYIEVQLQK